MVVRSANLSLTLEEGMYVLDVPQAFAAAEADCCSSILVPDFCHVQHVPATKTSHLVRLEAASVPQGCLRDSMAGDVAAGSETASMAGSVAEQASLVVSLAGQDAPQQDSKKRVHSDDDSASDEQPSILRILPAAFESPEAHVHMSCSTQLSEEGSLCMKAHIQDVMNLMKSNCDELQALFPRPLLPSPESTG